MIYNHNKFGGYQKLVFMSTLFTFLHQNFTSNKCPILEKLQAPRACIMTNTIYQVSVYWEGGEE